MYAALLVDVKGSKAYPAENRVELQNYLDATLSVLNRIFRGDIVKEVGFSGGDEVQGLFGNPINAYRYFRLLSLTLGVGVFRCGIGVGEWDVRLSKRTESAAQDGEAYHLAREAIGDAARSDYYDLVCRLRGSLDDQVTVLLDHSWGQCKMRTDTQNEIALLASLLYPLVLDRGDDAFFGDGYCGNALDLISLFAERSYGRRKASGVAVGLLEHAGRRGLRIQPCEGRELLGIGGARRDTLVGAAREIASLAGVSHQGVGRKIAQGRLVQERCAIAFARHVLMGGLAI